MAQKIDVIEYYDRQKQQICQERVMGDAGIKWAYQTMSGRLIAPLLFHFSFLSRLLGFYFDSSLSRRQIKGTIADLQIDESEFAQETETFVSFNDFFTRKLKKEARPFDTDPQLFITPADGRLLVYDQLGNDQLLPVKGAKDSITNLFGRPMEQFHGGKVAVIRLCPSDYHRYHFPCDGEVIDEVAVSGLYHSVNPIALAANERVFCLNKRSYTLIDTAEFGQIAFMEVGAFGVSGICQTYEGTAVSRMQEKGYFKFGGSTIVLLLQKGTITFDSDLLANSEKGIETLVRVGERIGSVAG